MTLTSNAAPPIEALSAPSHRCPLVVDVDGTLVRSDLLWEGVLNVVFRQPGQTFRLIWASLRGGSALKELVASLGAPAADTLPLEPEVVQLIEQARTDGRTVLLMSGANERQVKALVERVKAAEGYGSTVEINLTGVNKLRAIHALCREFDYIGNALTDLPLWTAARHAYAVNVSPVTRWLARKRRRDLVVLARDVRFSTAWLRALRPHQWVKNVLLLLPGLAAHLAPTQDLVVSALLGVFGWSLASSGTYVLNDLIDLDSDRWHATKRRRPFAAGEISVLSGLVSFALLWAVGIRIAAALSTRFAYVLMFHIVLSTAYSLSIKRRPIVDVLVLAVLYTLRVVAGAVLFAVPLSRWFLAFSVFLFFSLAVLKRGIELRVHTGEGMGRSTPAGALIPGRGYRTEDLPVLVGLGAAAGIASSLVYCLYITSTDVARLYERPDLLWIGLPILLFVQGRMWLLAGRREMQEDPVVFALTDRPSLLAAVMLLLTVALSAKWICHDLRSACRASRPRINKGSALAICCPHSPRALAFHRTAAA
jgi:4-hydroxybenzoate polyprenyltransferase/phosphoserine phosphatase